MHRIAFTPCLPLAIVFLASTSPAQTRVGFNLTGMWSSMYHEDELERTDPGAPVGDYLGLPINDDDRLRADTWDADLISVPEHQCIPHSAPYAMRGPSNLKISTLDDPANCARAVTVGKDVAHSTNETRDLARRLGSGSGNIPFLLYRIVSGV